jgi:hypothetical protein
MLCGFFNVNKKLFRLSSHLYCPLEGDSHSFAANPPKIFPCLSLMIVSVFGCPSDFAWNLNNPNREGIFDNFASENLSRGGMFQNSFGL